MRFLFLESFFGGSHRDFAEGLIAHSRYPIDLVTLPARFWKWRMRGAALYFLKQIRRLDGYGGLITTDLMSLSDFKALCGPTCPPALVYFHENQLTYPLAEGQTMDYQFGFTDITTALAANRVLFNSDTHFEAFFSRLPAFLGMMPEYVPKWVVEAIRAKAGVLYPGCRFQPAGGTRSAARAASPLIIWNHRWEFDKNPASFFDALDAMLNRGLDFRLALMGENFSAIPEPFVTATARYGARIVQNGYVRSRRQYAQWLTEGDIVVSTAIQENFGISVIEAIRHGCIPLLPRRLVYPEIVPEAFHRHVFYENQQELVEKLCGLVRDIARSRTKVKGLAESMERFSWEHLIDRYDEELLALARR